jgi:hypothetical protein|tara:strand:- start:166 stop:348 length:183 start_codon:yes stop_codon:yes gene_type:complete
MISIRNIGSENTTGFKIIVLWIFSIQGMYQEIKGGHLSFGGCIGPIGISFNLHMYDTMLP